MSVTYPPYTVMICRECDAIIDPDSAPYAEGDRTKPTADYEHYAAKHPELLKPAGPHAIGFPYTPWNDKPVTREDNHDTT